MNAGNKKDFQATGTVAHIRNNNQSSIELTNEEM